MQKQYYLQYFTKNISKTNQTQPSFDQSWASNHKITPEIIDSSGLCSSPTKQEHIVEIPFSNLSNYLHKSDSPKNSFFKNHTRKCQNARNFKIHNQSCQMFKKIKQAEGNQQPQQRKTSNFRKNLSEHNSEQLITQQLKKVQIIKPTPKNSNIKNPSQFGIQQIRTLDGPMILQNEKIFTQPIKPYDRNKTARNKKFRTLKTAFGDLNSSCRNYNDEYTMSLQNLRMGWRIVNTKSMIEEYLNSTYFTYHLYNGNVINKEKNKESAQKQKKKINLKQMKNIYKVFFNQSIMFNKKLNKNPSIFQSIKRKNQVHDYVLSQSQMNFKTHSNQCLTPDQRLKENLARQTQSPVQIYRGSHKTKPCFFRKTYNQKYSTHNTKICEQQKHQKLSKSLYCKTSKSVFKGASEAQPQQISMEEDNFQMNQIFGKGNTIIQLRDLSIETPSTFKKDDLLVLQLMARKGTINLKNGMMSSPIKYSEIKNGIKFAIDSKVGDFIPLKIWKYHGINLLEVGIIDLNMVVFRNRKKYFGIGKKIQTEPWSDGIQDIQVFRQQQQSLTTKNKLQEREILYYETKQKLRKNQKMQIQVTVSLKCLIYNKRFSTQRTNFKDNYKKENPIDDDHQNDINFE